MSSPPVRHEPQPQMERKRLLLVKFGAIGDVVMAIPAAAAMHEAGYSVDWVCGIIVAPILRMYPWINVLTVDDAKLLRGSLGERLRHTFALWQILQQTGRGRYDLCATLYYDRRYRLLTLPVRSKRWVSLSPTDRSRRLLPGRHHTDEFARMLSGGLDGEKPNQLAPVPVPNLPPSPRPRQPGRARVVLVPAGARNTLRDDALRRWPVASYVAVARGLLARGYEVVLQGGPEDGWASPHFVELAAVADPGSFADLIGAFSLAETLALLDSADVTVTHDTGPLHLAGITSTAIVTVFGPTDPRGRLPQRANAVALWGGEGFACRPCYDGHEYAPCTHNGCMEQVTPGMVLAEVEALLRARAEGREMPPRIVSPEHTPVVQIVEGSMRA